MIMTFLMIGPERMANMDTILVTGGAGFIGSNFIRFLIGKYPEDRIINLDKLTYAGNLENLKGIVENEKYCFIKGDICDAELINRIFNRYNPNFVVNFAAESHVDRSILDPQVFIKTNVLGTQVLLDACRKVTTLYKYIQVSTDEVYGSLGSTGYFTEDTSLAPNSPYSASKAGADMLVRAYYETFGLHVNITRCSNNYGPYQFPEKLIPLFINNAQNNKELPLYGDGLNIRDWLYVVDHCIAIDLVMRKGKSGEVYNIGGNNEKTNIEITKCILSSLGRNENLVRHVQDRLGHDRRYAIDSSKIKKELKWEPLTCFEEGIKSTINWYIDNKRWLKNVISKEYLKYYEIMYTNK